MVKPCDRHGFPASCGLTGRLPDDLGEIDGLSETECLVQTNCPQWIERYLLNKHIVSAV